MKVIYEIGKVKKPFKNSVMTIGVFDGLHRGHQKLIKETVRNAKKLNGESIVLTFWPHPHHVVHPKLQVPSIVSLPHRLELFKASGISVCIVVKFSRSFSSLSPEDFVKKYIYHYIKPKMIIVGDDFRFGKDRKGTLSLFKKLAAENGFRVKALSHVKTNSKKISSTHIRKLIKGGKLNDANKLLGHKVTVVGKVVKGDQRGRTLGFPTANIMPQDEILPPEGIYAVRVEIDRKIYNGMANVGRNPTFKKDKDKVVIEVFVFNLRKNIYGKPIAVEFVEKFRSEKKFVSKEKLVEQLRLDKEQAIKILKD